MPSVTNVEVGAGAGVRVRAGIPAGLAYSERLPSDYSTAMLSV
jgi:hypothetical protein